MNPIELLPREIEDRLNHWSQVHRHRPAKGWLSTMRQALGMSAAQLAARLGISRQGVADLERRELEDAVTLAALRKAATAMECDLVYAIVPRTTLATTMEDQALAKATAEANRVHSENQEIGKAAIERLIEERFAALLGEARKELWLPSS